MGSDSILVHRTGGVLQLTLNRPERRNALGAADLSCLVDEIALAAADEEIRAVLLSGHGEAFCASHDLTSDDLGERGASAWNQVLMALHQLPKPTVAAVNGTAVGGGLHLALACDLALCVDSAILGEPFVGIGSSPDTGGHLYLQRSIGHARTAAMLLLGETLTGREAASTGLFLSSWPTVDELLEEALRVATKLANGPRLAYRVIREGLEYARLHGLAEILAWEAEKQEHIVKTTDMQEGVTAFLEKRQPSFRGR